MLYIHEIDISSLLIIISYVDDTEYHEQNIRAACRITQNEIKYPVQLKDVVKWSKSDMPTLWV